MGANHARCQRRRAGRLGWWRSGVTSFAMTADDPHCEKCFGALPQNFSMQEKIFHIEKY
jgi:hypothetical protein